MLKYLNQKSIKHLLLSSFLLIAAACTEDLNTLPEDDDTQVGEQVLTTEEDFLQLLAGVYSNFTLPSPTGPTDSNIQGLDAGSSVFTRTLWYLQELSTDAAIWSYENDPGVADVQRNTWNETNEFVSGMFGRMALTLALSTNFIQQASGSDIPAVSQMTAEARFLRALTYYYYLDLFGKAPFLADDAPIGDTTFRPEQAERQQLFDFVESEALDLLNLLPAAGSGEYGRADAGAVQMLLAKLYLNAQVYVGQDRYTDCLTYCNLLIASYNLNPVYDYNFTADNDRSGEIIFPLISDGAVSQSFGGTTIIINGEWGAVEQNSAELGVSGTFGGALRLRQQMSEILLDPASGSRNTLSTAGRTIDNADIAIREFGYVHTKFKNVTSSGSAGRDEVFVDTDYPLFRLGDVYLMYAEAVLRNGSGGTEGEAVNLINELRDRVNAPTINPSDLTLDFILDERARELFWEGHRRQDLIRFGQFTGGSYNWEWKGSSQSGTSIAEHLSLYPIPARSLSQNPNLTQNTGY